MNITRRLPPLLPAACLALAAHTVSAQTVNPDPELFDGTRTKKEQIQQDEKKSADKWEDANLILYDSDEQGSAEGGQGRVGGEGPGYADGAQAGVSIQAGIPMPMGGGGGSPSDQQTMPGMIPVSQQSTPTAGGPSSQDAPPSGSPGSAGKPGEVPIGDPSQRIATTAQTVNKVQGGIPPPPTGEPIEKSKGEETSTIPNSASGQQSGQRGGGVEKGDAMPTDI